jgi:tRNA-2-methylthio-N6-dimethylallyladenosine synthase
VPYTRGPEYSRPFNQILDEAKYLTDSGTQEIILLGQNVNAYNDKKYRLSDLIIEIEKLAGIKRIRYTTSHPKDMTDDLIEVYKHSKKLMSLVHLPVQSGSNKILDLMNRKHNISEYYKIYDRLKEINSDIQFSSDFIIGYPGEEEKDFNATFELIQKIKFINSYSFIFSPRPGTVAADLKLIDKKVSMERLEKVQSELYANQMQMNKSLEDKTINVLVENLTDDKSQVFGRSEYMTSVIFNGNKDDIGKIVPVKINRSNRSTLFGEKDLSYKQKVA